MSPLFVWVEDKSSDNSSIAQRLLSGSKIETLLNRDNEFLRLIYCK